MKAPIIKIGNSKGLVLSTEILERYQISDEVQLIFEEESIVIKPIKSPRKGWKAAFKRMSKNGDDQLLIDDVLKDSDLVD